MLTGTFVQGPTLPFLSSSPQVAMDSESQNDRRVLGDVPDQPLLGQFQQDRQAPDTSGPDTASLVCRSRPCAPIRRTCSGVSPGSARRNVTARGSPLMIVEVLLLLPGVRSMKRVASRTDWVGLQYRPGCCVEVEQCTREVP